MLMGLLPLLLLLLLLQEGGSGAVLQFLALNAWHFPILLFHVAIISFHGQRSEGVPQGKTIRARAFPEENL